MHNAKRKLFFCTLVTMSLFPLLLLGVDSVTAHDKGNDRLAQFTAIDTSCELVSEGTTTVDAEGVTHVEGEIYKGIVISDNPLMAGTSYIVVDSVIKPDSNIIRLWVTAFFYPDAVQGTWIAPGQGQVSPEALLVRHSGRGTRDLRKALIKFHVRFADVDPASLPCEPVIPPAALKGVIIDKR